jgi:hypothetical protein
MPGGEITTAFPVLAALFAVSDGCPPFSVLSDRFRNDKLMDS